MITSFKSLGQSGGGGGGYVLPTATANRLGGVMIGQGINVDSAGTISVSGSDVSNYAMALKSIQEGDENNYKVANYGGFLYYVEDNKNTEENIFVKVRYDANYVNIDMEIDGQTDTDIFEISNGDFSFAIAIDKEGNLFYVNENDEEVYYNSEVDEYQYGDFIFTWESNGKHISFPQQSSPIEANALTDNCEYWYCVGQNMNIANQDRLGLVKIGEGIDLAEDGTISVSGGGGGIEVVTELPASGTDGQVVVLVDSATSSTTEYIWSDTPLLAADIDYTESSGDTIASNNNWLVRFRFEDLPNNTKLAIIQEKTYNNYGHFVYENGEIHRYSSDNASAYTASTYLNVLKNQIRSVGVWNGISDNGYNSARMFWNDEEIVLFANGGDNRRVWFNTDSFYKSGWVKNKTYKIEKNAFYSNYTWYNADYNIIIKHPDYNLYDVTLKINPNSQHSEPFKVYSKNNSAIGPIFAPTTTGQTGYVCVAGNGWAAPTWKNPSTLLNKSTLYGTHSTFIVAIDEWKLLGTSFDAGNFYIYNTCDFNETTEIVDFNDSTDDGEGGMTEPTQELKVSANTDGSYDVFYGTYSDYEGGVYSYTASTHLDTVFSEYNIPTEDQTGYVVKMILRPDGLYCYENYSSCGFVNNIYSTFGVGDSVTIGKITVFVNYEDTLAVYLSQDEGV